MLGFFWMLFRWRTLFILLGLVAISALIPVGGWGPTLGEQGHLDAARAAEALRVVKADWAVPVHYGTFPFLDQDPAKFVAAMAGQNVVIPEIGKPFEL